MNKSTLKQKVYLNVFMPVTAVFILNNFVLLTLETPGYFIINLITFVTVLTVSILSLRNLSEKISKDSTDSSNSEVINHVYADLKKLLTVCCQKDSLPIAKELVRICSELGPLTDKPKIDNGPFQKGSLRRAFRIEEFKAA